MGIEHIGGSHAANCGNCANLAWRLQCMHSCDRTERGRRAPAHTATLPSKPLWRAT